MRVNLRSRVVSTGDAALLDRFEADMATAGAQPPRSSVKITPEVAPASSSLQPAPRAARGATVPAPADAPPHPVRDPVQEPPPRPHQDVESPARSPHHVFVVTVLLEAVERQYGVVAASMGDALATASRTLPAGVVVAGRRDLPALV